MGNTCAGGERFCYSSDLSAKASAAIALTENAVLPSSAPLMLFNSDFSLLGSIFIELRDGSGNVVSSNCEGSLPNDLQFTPDCSNGADYVFSSYFGCEEDKRKLLNSVNFSLDCPAAPAQSFFSFVTAGGPNTSTNIVELVDGEITTVLPDTLAAGFNILYKADAPNLRTVIFFLDGERFSSESRSPYHACGDFDRNPAQVTVQACDGKKKKLATAPGVHTIEARAFDGSSTTVLGSAQYEIFSADVAPSVSFVTSGGPNTSTVITSLSKTGVTSIPMASLSNGFNILYDGIVGDGSAVAFYVDGQKVGAESQAPYHFCGDHDDDPSMITVKRCWGRKLAAITAAGVHTLLIKEWDGSSNTDLVAVQYEITA